MEAPDVVLILSALGNVVLIAYNITNGFRKFPAERSSMNAQASVDTAQAFQSWIDTTSDLTTKLQQALWDNFTLKQENAVLKGQVSQLQTDIETLKGQVETLMKAAA